MSEQGVDERTITEIGEILNRNIDDYLQLAEDNEEKHLYEEHMSRVVMGDLLLGGMPEERVKRLEISFVTPDDIIEENLEDELLSEAKERAERSFGTGVAAKIIFERRQVE